MTCRVSGADAAVDSAAAGGTCRVVFGDRVAMLSEVRTLDPNGEGSWLRGVSSLTSVLAHVVRTLTPADGVG